jgi:transcription-repair coupling factor (superfamily II helicase)
MAVALGFEKMLVKEDTLKCYFVNNPDSPYFTSDVFNRMIEFLQKGTNKGKLKQMGKLFLLIVDDIRSMTDLQEFLGKMHAFVVV